MADLDLHDVFLEHERRIRERFLQLVESQRERLRSVVERYLRTGDSRDLERALIVAVSVLGEEVARTYLEAASATARWLSDATGTTIGVDTTDWRVTRALTDSRVGLVRALVDDQMNAVTLAATYERSQDPDWVLTLLGLTALQVTEVNRYRSSLGLVASRPRRTALIEDADGVVVDPLDDPTPVDRVWRVGDVERMSREFARRRLSFRSEVLGEAEANKAVHRAQLDVLQQVVDLRLLDSVQVVRTWHCTLDGKERASHNAMHLQARDGVVDPFRSGLGNYLMFPGDSSAPAKDWAGCRCSLRVGVRT